MLRPVDIFAVHSGAGGGEERAGEGPRALQQAGIIDWVKASGVPVAWHDIGLDFADLAAEPRPRINYAAKVFADLAHRIEHATAAGHFTLTLGGDHSCSIGTWSGTSNALATGEELGLIWIDAHMDAHVPETSPSGNLHGMPIAHLLGHGAPELIALARPMPAIEPVHLAMLGGRSYEDAEPMLLEESGVRFFWMPEVLERGFAPCIAEAREIVATRAGLYGISIDIDALDPRDISGTGLPVENGIRAVDLLAALDGIARDPKLLGIEFAEFVPALDRDGQTLDLIRRLIGAIFA